MTTHDEIVCEVDAARDADPTGLGRRLAAAVRGERLHPIHQEQDHAVEGSEMKRVLYSYQNRAATFFYERDVAFLVAPLGAGKGAAALTAVADLIRDDTAATH